MSEKLFAAIVVTVLLVIQSTVSAGGYQKFLNGDANCILFDGHQGVARYDVKDTLKVDAQNPYTLSIDWVTVPRAWDGDNTVTARDKFCFVYDCDARKIFVVNPKTGERRYLSPNVSRAEGFAAMCAAELAFYLATGEKFYGFADEFYPDK